MRPTWIERRSIAPVLALWAALALTAPSVAQDGPPDSGPEPDVSALTLIAELADPMSLARPARFPYRSHLASSWDRGAKAGPGSPAWFADNDSGHFESKEEKDGRLEYVLAAADGPGAIVRIWLGWRSGRIRVYLDGAVEPAIDVEVATAFTGQNAIFAGPFSQECHGGRFVRFPIPYAKSMKVTCDVVPAEWQVAYRTYREGPKVETFAMKNAGIATIRAAEAIQSLTRGASSSRLVYSNAGLRSTLHPDAVVRVARLNSTTLICDRKTERPHYVSWIGFAALGRQLDEQSLRGLMIRMAFDGEWTVEIPLIDLFGGLSDVDVRWNSFLAGIEPGNGSVRRCSLPMPFRNRLEIELVNEGQVEVRHLAFHVVTRPMEWTPGTMYLHAAHRADLDHAVLPFKDWSVVDIKGAGVYVADVTRLDVAHTSDWDLGGERVFVDGEAFPSHFGTRVGAYYGTSALKAHGHTSPYHLRRVIRRDNGRRTEVLARWRGLDAIPFGKGLKVGFELRPAEQERIGVSTTAFWYARAVKAH